MNAPLTREQAISLRIDEILMDGDAVADLFDKINQHGGLSQLALIAGLRQRFYGCTAAIREAGATQAENIVRAFAFLQASNEYDGLPLVRGVAR